MCILAVFSLVMAQCRQPWQGTPKGKQLMWLNSVHSFGKIESYPFMLSRIFNAAVLSAVLYGCESLLVYNWCVKQLLCFRLSTCTNVCFAEFGLPTLRFLIIAKRRKFFKVYGMKDSIWWMIRGYML